MLKSTERLLYLIKLQKKYKDKYESGTDDDMSSNLKIFPSIWYQIKDNEIKISFLEEALNTSKRLEELEVFDNFRKTHYRNILEKNIEITRKNNNSEN